MKLSVLQRFVLVLILALPLVNACKKEDPAEPEKPCTFSYLKEIEIPYQHKTAFSLDGANRLSTVTYFDATGKEGQREIFKYNENGTVSAISFFEGNWEWVRYEFIYSGDRVTASRYLEDYFGQGVELLGNTTYFYDAQGRNIRAVTYRGETQDEKFGESENEFDTRGNLIRSTFYKYDDTLKTLETILEYTYDDKSNPLAKYPFLYEPGLGAMVNNRLTVKETSGRGTIREQSTFKYFYNTDNLPTRQHKVESDSFSILNAIYRYGCQ